MIFEIITTLAKVVPFIANIVGWAVWIVCFCLALIVWIITIAIAWLAVRPIYWVIALVAVIAIIVGMISLKKRNKESIVEKWGVVSVREEGRDDNKKDKDDVEIIEA